MSAYGKALEIEFTHLWNKNLHRLKNRDPSVARKASREMAAHLQRWCKNARRESRTCEQVALTALHDLSTLVRTTKGIDGDLARQYTSVLLDRARKQVDKPMVEVD